MGARSAEALAKRAAKRGMTVEEYYVYEREKSKDDESKTDSAAAKRKAPEVAARPAKKGRADAPRPRHGDWTCTACQFQNFASRDECKQCEAEAPSKEHRERALAARKDAKEKTTDPTRAWADSVGKNTQAHINDNWRLREDYTKDKTSLTEEERTRAEALLARDERKKQKKGQRSQAPNPAMRQNREEWRDLRRKEAAARPPKGGPE